MTASRTVLLVLALAGCAPHAMPPRELADVTTRAVYDGDLARTRAHFDDHLRAVVTPTSLAAVSRAMHRFGAYRDLTTLAQVADQRRYFYEAEFDRGSMLVQLRLNKDGSTIAAYRVTPNVAH